MKPHIPELHAAALARKSNNCVTRHQCLTSLELDAMDKEEDIRPKALRSKVEGRCYGCGRATRSWHGNYVFSCLSCGKLFQRNRYLSSSQEGKVALVTGARTKLGHQVCLKLLRAGALVIGTTRRPDKALELYAQYPDFANWVGRLYVFPLDLDSPNLRDSFDALRDWIMHVTGITKLDILINCAAQTIRSRDRMPAEEREQITEKNRYGDSKYAPIARSSWDLTLELLEQREMEELFRINAIAPVLLTQAFLDLLERSERAYIINVHAKEGLFLTHKTTYHMHTNMAKAAMAMFTRTLVEHKYRSKVDPGNPFSIHGCDPGWISIDEYGEHQCPWLSPPIDERDGAARILYPVFKGIQASKPLTRKHFEKMCA